MADLFQKNEQEELDSIQQKLRDLENQMQGLNPRNLAGLQSKELKAAARANLFGDGSDGDVTLTSNTTLTEDKFYDTLIIDNGVVLTTNGWRVFCKKDLINNGTIRSNGNDGNPGTTPPNAGSTRSGGGGGGSGSPGGNIQLWANRIINNGTVEAVGGDGGDGGDGNADTAASTSSGPGGSGGAAAHTGGSLPDAIAGQSGGSADSGGGASAGGTGSDSDPGFGSAGTGGGGGGTANATAAGDGGDGGSVVPGKNVPRSPTAAYLLYDVQDSAQQTGSAGSGGGGGGASSDTGSHGGGGGGGAGGSGGVVMLIYGSKSGAGTVDVSGGAGGAKGLGDGGLGEDGADGAAGGAGTEINIEVG